MLDIREFSQTSGRIQKVDPPQGFIVQTIGILEFRIGGSTFWILPGVWVVMGCFELSMPLFGDPLSSALSLQGFTVQINFRGYNKLWYMAPNFMVKDPCNHL